VAAELAEPDAVAVGPVTGLEHEDKLMLASLAIWAVVKIMMHASLI
jgi:hypothetical protein